MVTNYGKVGFVTLLTWIVRGDAALASKLGQDPDVARALTLHAEAVHDETQSNDARIYAIGGVPSQRDAEKHIKDSRLILAAVKANALLLPESPEIVNELANVLEARGESAERTKVLEQAKAAKVPLPYELLAK